MNIILHSPDLRRKIFCHKTNTIKLQTKLKFKHVLNQFEQELDSMYNDRHHTVWSHLDHQQISNLSRDQYFTSMIEELAQDKYFSMHYWLIDSIIEHKNQTH